MAGANTTTAGGSTAAVNAAGRTGVRIVVAGGQGTGKSSLIVTAATDNFPMNVPPVLPPTRLPEDFYPDRIPITIIDTSSSNEDREKLTDELKSADPNIRFVKNKDTNECKGYAFVLFTTKDAARKAIEELHDKLFKGKTLRCSLSEAKHRLFIGNVPKSMTEDEFRNVIEQTGPGSENIELMKDPQNPNQNRGYAFVEYYNNACADYSRQKMTSADFKLYGNTPTVNWVDKKITSDKSSASAASQVKSLYVKNIPDNTSTEEVKELFQQHGEITRVVMPPSRSGSGKRDFAFIHYAERSSALKAVKDGEKHEIYGKVLEVALANPQNDKKSGGSLRPHNSGSRPNYVPPHPGYGGFAATPYTSMVGGYGVAPITHQPMIYGASPMTAGAQMVPMVLPDGQIAYVLQQPGMQMPPPQPSRRNDRNSGHRGDDGNRGRRYRPY